MIKYRDFFRPPFFHLLSVCHHLEYIFWPVVYVFAGVFFPLKRVSNVVVRSSFSPSSCRLLPNSFIFAQDLFNFCRAELLVARVHWRTHTPRNCASQFSIHSLPRHTDLRIHIETHWNVIKMRLNWFALCLSFNTIALVLTGCFLLHIYMMESTKGNNVFECPPISASPGEK